MSTGRAARWPPRPALRGPQAGPGRGLPRAGPGRAGPGRRLAARTFENFPLLANENSDP